MTLWDSIFRKRNRIDQDAMLVDASFIVNAWHSAAAGKWKREWRMYDREYVMLTQAGFNSLLARHWDPDSFSWKQNGEEYPDCDDGARMCMGRLIAGGLREGLKHQAAFGTVDFQRAGHPQHLQMWSILAPRGQLRIFQVKPVAWEDYPRDVESLLEWRA